MTFKKTFAVAPMLKWTTKHCRYFYRLLSPQSMLYTEMVIAQAFLKSGVENTPRPQWEHPITLQLAGSDPEQLGIAARLAKDLGFDALNFNVGCPSTRLQHLNSGAKAFLSPRLVGECVRRMRAESHLPVSIKTRIGVDDCDSDMDLWNFLEETHHLSGCTNYVLHARKAFLSGLNPSQNRSCPPLNYQSVYAAKNRYPHLSIILNGGLKSIDDALDCFKSSAIDGVMIGRAVWNDPKILFDVEQQFFGQTALPDSKKIFEALNNYFQLELASNPRWKKAFFPLFNLFKNTPWSKRWKKELLTLENDSKNLENFFKFYQKIFFEIENEFLNKNKACIQ